LDSKTTINANIVASTLFNRTRCRPQARQHPTICNAGEGEGAAVHGGGPTARLPGWINPDLPVGIRRSAGLGWSWGRQQGTT
jgi:hypothetical protein